MENKKSSSSAVWYVLSGGFGLELILSAVYGHPELSAEFLRTFFLYGFSISFLIGLSASAFYALDTVALKKIPKKIRRPVLFAVAISIMLFLLIGYSERYGR